MTSSDMTLEEKIRVLSNDLQREVEDFVEFLLAKQRRAELERTAIAIGSCFLFPGERCIAGRRLEEKFRRGRENRGSANFCIQQSAGRKRDVAHDLALYPQPRSPGQQTIVRILGVQLRSDFRALAIGRGSDNQAVDVFETPGARVSYMGYIVK